jgi:RNA polymerase sigma factor (sigma-70 family)
LVEDAEQEVWLHAFQKLQHLRDGACFRPWLMQVADTTCLGILRKSRRREEAFPTVDADVDAVNLAAKGSRDPIEDLWAATEMLAGIPQMYSEVLVLRYVQGLSIREISEETGLSISGVKQRIHKAINALRETMSEMSGHDEDQASVKKLLDTAEEAVQLSRWEEAIECYEAASRKADLDWHSLSNLGRIYERRGDFPRAIKLLEQALRISYWAWFHVLMGWCYDGLGEREMAIAIYEQVLASGTAGSWAAGAALAGLKAPHERRRSEPEPAGKERAVPRTGWSVKTNHNPDMAHLAIDGDLGTQWHSGAPQDHNMYFQLDLGREWNLKRIVLDDDGNGQFICIANCPHGYAIDTSLDGVTWSRVAEGSADYSRYAGANLEGSPVRHLRFRLTRNFHPNWWSIYEIRVYAS